MSSGGGGGRIVPVGNRASTNEKEDAKDDANAENRDAHELLEKAALARAGLQRDTQMQVQPHTRPVSAAVSHAAAIVQQQQRPATACHSQLAGAGAGAAARDVHSHRTSDVVGFKEYRGVSHDAKVARGALAQQKQ